MHVCVVYYKLCALAWEEALEKAFQLVVGRKLHHVTEIGEERRWMPRSTAYPGNNADKQVIVSSHIHSRHINDCNNRFS